MRAAGRSRWSLRARRISGCAYRRLEKLSVEEAVGAMAAAVEKGQGETEEKATGEKEKGGEQE